VESQNKHWLLPFRIKNMHLYGMEVIFMSAYMIHEVRMWTVQVIIPTAIIGIYLYKNNDTFKQKVNKIFHIKKAN
jgi:hypothetical protein